MKRVNLLNKLCVLLAFMAMTGVGWALMPEEETVFTVDASRGDEDTETEFKTLGAAVLAANKSASEKIVIEVANGDYKLEPTEGEYSGQAGWYLPIEKAGLIIKGESRDGVHLLSNTHTDNGCWSTQNLITIFSDDVTLENMTITCKTEVNKVVEVVGENVTLKNITCTPPGDENFAGSIYFSADEENTEKDCGTVTIENVTLEKGRFSFSGVDKGIVNMSNVQINFVGVGEGYQEYLPFGGLKEDIKMNIKEVSVSVSELFVDTKLFDNIPSGVVVKLASGDYDLGDAAWTIPVFVQIESLDPQNLAKIQGGFIVDANDVVLTNLDIETAGTPLTVNAGKTGVKVEGGVYKSSLYGKQGEGVIRFLGDNGDLSIKGVTAQGGFFIGGCTGSLAGVTGNTITYSAGDPSSFVALNVVFKNTPVANQPTPAEWLALQTNITMPENGAHYQVLYQDASWNVVDGLAEVSNAEALIGLAKAKKDNCQIGLTQDISLSAPVKFDCVGIVLNGNGHKITLDADLNKSYAITLGDNFTEQRGAFTVKNLTIDAAGKGRGFNVYQMADVQLESLTVKNSTGAGVVVNGSVVTASGLVLENNTWGGVNVAPGSGVTSDCVFTLSGDKNQLQEKNAIYVDAEKISLINAADGQKITISSPGYVMGDVKEGQAAVWKKYVIPEGGVSSEEELQEALDNNESGEIELKAPEAEEGKDAVIELTKPLEVTKEVTIKSADPENPVVVSVPAGTSAFKTKVEGEQKGSLTLENVSVKVAEPAEGATVSNPVIDIVAGTTAKLTHTSLEVPASVTAIQTAGEMTIEKLSLTVSSSAVAAKPAVDITVTAKIVLKEAATVKGATIAVAGVLEVAAGSIFTDGTIELSGNGNLDLSKGATFTSSTEKPALKVTAGTAVVTNANFTGKAIEATSGILTLSNCNFKPVATSKTMSLRADLTGEIGVVVTAGDAETTLNRCIMTDITGVGTLVAGTKVKIYNSLFYGNGNMRLMDIAAGSTVSILNNTFMNETSSSASSIIKNEAEASVIKNNILWTKATQSIEGSKASTDNIGHNAMKISGLATQDNIALTAKPSFASATDFRLNTGASVDKLLIGKGELSEAIRTALGDKDMYGNARFSNGKTTVNIGAVESTYTYTPSIPGGDDDEEDATISVSGVVLDKDKAMLKIGETITLKATVTPANADNKEVTWKSSDAAIAGVDRDGKVTALKAGKAIITVTTKDQAKTATCEITVSVPTGIESVSEGSHVYGLTGVIVIDAAEVLDVHISNMTGKSVFSNKIEIGKTYIQVPTGIYALTFRDGNCVIVTQKIMVK